MRERDFYEDECTFLRFLSRTIDDLIIATGSNVNFEWLYRKKTIFTREINSNKKKKKKKIAASMIKKGKNWKYVAIKSVQLSGVTLSKFVICIA